MKPDSKPVKTGEPPRWLVGVMTLLALSTTAHGWAPNARDRAAAMNAGNFNAYSDRLAEWLNQQVPADPARITKDSMMALLKDPGFVGALAERQFIGKVWDQPTPFSPPSGLATGSHNGLNPKSKFLAFI